jgi:hypothetical protein
MRVLHVQVMDGAGLHPHIPAELAERVGRTRRDGEALVGEQQRWDGRRAIFLVCMCRAGF